MEVKYYDKEDFEEEYEEAEEGYEEVQDEIEEVEVDYREELMCGIELSEEKRRKTRNYKQN